MTCVRYRGLTLVLTFLCYTSYHLSRKPISIVKIRSHLTPGMGRGDVLGSPWDSGTDVVWCRPSAASPVTAPVGTLPSLRSGIFGERLPLRYHLSAGMVLSGLFTALFGLVSFWNIHVLWYFIIMQVCNGLVQTTGWPSVVACVGNWFGKGKRGFIMGIWNSHTSVGNILGSLVAGVWVSSAWGFSFVVPGIVIAIMGIISFFFLVEYPEDVGCNPPMHHMASDEEDVGGVASKEKDPEAVTSHEGPLKVSGQSSGDHSNSPKEPAEEPEAISFLGALRIPGVVEFFLCLLFAKLVSYTFLYWLPLYIVNVAHFGAKEAGDLSTLFDVGGILGGIFAGLVSDYTGGRATTCCVMLVVAAPMVRCHVGKKQSQGFLLLQFL
ncbi:glucose-6-phosphate exchanger SLC37A2-like [Phaenicophaeus curvirostris]|uniref:glucose-6-phosphate exchanger SLC37A2-like n=1 Tax=Phaenicophaeus curvirostris TaxID=33595 RepID=UPI0037F0F657